MWPGLSLVWLLLIGGTTAGEAKIGGQAPMKTAHVNNGTAKLTVYFPATFYIAAPRPIKAVVENTGKRNLVYFSPDVKDGFLYAVADDDGKAVARTRYGKTLPTKPRNWWDGKVGRVRPGEKFEMELDPMRAFDMTVPGSYKLNLDVRGAFYIDIPGDNLSGDSIAYSNFSVGGIRFDVKEGPAPGPKKAN